MANIISSNEVLLGAQGRVVIPVALRKALGLKPGERLIARKEGESLVLERREVIEKNESRTRRLCATGISPSGTRMGGSSNCYRRELHLCRELV